MRLEHILDALLDGGLGQQLAVEQVQDDFARQLAEDHLLAEELAKDRVDQVLVQVLVQRLVVDRPQLDQDVRDVLEEELAHRRNWQWKRKCRKKLLLDKSLLGS